MGMPSLSYLHHHDDEGPTQRRRGASPGLTLPPHTLRHASAAAWRFATRAEVQRRGGVKGGFRRRRELKGKMKMLPRRARPHAQYKARVLVEKLWIHACD